MMGVRPPKLAEKILLFFLKDELAEEVLGDLDEKFSDMLEDQSLRGAKLNYWYQVFHYLRPFAFKYYRTNTIFPTMLRHNLLIGYRILIKNKTFSAINIGGLAIGMLVFLLISLWINHELSFNKQHQNYDSIVQVYRKNINTDGSAQVNTSLAGQMGVLLEENYSHLFEQVAMTFFRSRPQLLTVDKQAYDMDGLFIQPSAPHMLTLDMIHGSRTGLNDRKGILLSESLARTFFGDENPIGKIVNLNLRTDLEVTGVYSDIADNSAFANASFMASMELIYNEKNPYVWNNYNIRIYAQLQPSVDIETASAAIADMMVPHRDSEDGGMSLFLVPMKDWHLRANYTNGFLTESKSMQFVKLYGIVGAFVLLLAFIKFMNLNTARYQGRAKEVGIRKTFGSRRVQLIWQFLAESMLYAGAAFVLAILLAWLVLPWFNILAGKVLYIPWAAPAFWGIGLLFTFVSGLIAGSYPAIMLSSFVPLQALKGSLRQGISSVRLRQVLVVFQFSVSIMLLIGTFTVHQQTKYGKTRPTGYSQDALISLRGRSGQYYEKYNVLRTEILATGVVDELATANYPLTNTLGNNDGFKVAETDEVIDFTFNTIFVTPEYGQTVKWQLIAGRDFIRGRALEKGSIILSESAVNRIGLENPIGSVLESRYEFNGRKRFKIIGVVRDMIKGSPFEEPRPLMVFANEEASPYLFIKLKPEARYTEALPLIEQTFDAVLPGHPFNFEFVDDTYALKFKAEEKISSLATLFSVLAILISALGLFGLSAFIIEQRTKEIGVRKVLGASFFAVWRLLSKDFAYLVLLATLLTVPIASYLLESWLDGYQYRTVLQWWMYAAAGLLGLAVMLSTVSIHAVRASLVNPADTLRSE
jgi:ABC-type antimicrobial peptide transport system permease subunit